MARNKLTGGRPDVAVATKQKKSAVDLMLDKMREAMQGAMAQRQVIANDLKQIKGNIQFQGQDWEKSDYVALLIKLEEEQEQVINTIGAFIETVLSGQLAAPVKTYLAECEKVAETIKPRFVDYTKLSPQEFVTKYKEA